MMIIYLRKKVNSINNSHQKLNKELTCRKCEPLRKDAFLKLIFLFTGLIAKVALEPLLISSCDILRHSILLMIIYIHDFDDDDDRDDDNDYGRDDDEYVVSDR